MKRKNILQTIETAFSAALEQRVKVIARSLKEMTDYDELKKTISWEQALQLGKKQKEMHDEAHDIIQTHQLESVLSFEFLRAHMQQHLSSDEAFDTIKPDRKQRLIQVVLNNIPSSGFIHSLSESQQVGFFKLGLRYYSITGGKESRDKNIGTVYAMLNGKEQLLIDQSIYWILHIACKCHNMAYSREMIKLIIMLKNKRSIVFDINQRDPYDCTCLDGALLTTRGLDLETNEEKRDNGDLCVLLLKNGARSLSMQRRSWAEIERRAFSEKIDYDIRLEEESGDLGEILKRQNTLQGEQPMPNPTAEEATATVDNLLELAKKIRNTDQTRDALFMAVECYGLAKAIIREYKLNEGNLSKVDKKIMSTIKKDFIFEELRVVSEIEIGYLCRHLEGYTTRLQLIRLKDRSQLANMQQYLIDVTCELKELFVDICNLCQNMLGFNSTEMVRGMSMVLLGSLATVQAMLYSDIEYFILLDRKTMQNERQRYEALASLIEILVISFGETPLFYAKSLLEAKGYTRYLGCIRKGFRIDEAKKPTAVNFRLDLVNSIENITDEHAQDIFRPGNHLSPALLTPRFLLGDGELFQKYQEALCAQLTKGRYTEFLRRLIDHNLQEQKHLVADLELAMAEKRLEKQFDLKVMTLYSINLAIELVYWLYARGKLEDLPAANTIWNALNILKTHVNREVCTSWSGFITQCMSLRIKKTTQQKSHTAALTLGELDKEIGITKICDILKDIRTATTTLKAALMNNNRSPATLISSPSSSSTSLLGMDTAVAAENARDHAAAAAPKGQRLFDSSSAGIVTRRAELPSPKK